MPIYISLFGLHFDPEYFPNPEKYDPERFTFENRNTRPAYSYMPFGEGPHNCIGKTLPLTAGIVRFTVREFFILGARFGVLGTKVALARILSEFEAEVCKETQIPLTFDQKGFLVAPERGLNLHFKRKE